MEKRKCVAFLFCLLLCFPLFQLAAIAQSSSGASIFSQGSIIVPSSGTNWAVIPTGWEGGSGLTNGGQFRHGGTGANCYYDTSVEYNGNPSIRDEGPASSSNPYREVDCNAYPGGAISGIKPGDHIVFTVWIKTNPSTIGETGGLGTFVGAIMGIDLYYNTNQRIWEVCPGTPDGSIAQTVSGTTFVGRPNYNDYNFVPYGTSTWVQRTMDFVIPSNTFTTDSEGHSIPASRVNAIVPWVGADGGPDGGYPSKEAGSVWFADAILYINPS